MAILAIGTALTVEVDPANYYYSTEVDVVAGEKYSLLATGKWKDLFRLCDATGWQSKLLQRFNRLPEQPFFLLCGSVGKSDTFAFVIGKELEWTVPDTANGELYLFANDWPFMYWNNCAASPSEGGPMIVRITRIH